MDRFTGAAERWIPDRVVHARTFRRNFGRPLDLRHPRTFNEKLYWLMLYDRRSILTRLTDKYEVRGHVAERIGAQYLNELYGVWDDPRAIDFSRRPATFVLKVTNGWSMNIFCRDRARFDAEGARAQLAGWRRRPHYWLQREWAYKETRSRVIAERLLVDARSGTPPGYKVSCFNGEPGWIGVHFDRFGERPANLDEMLACARRLAEGLSFVRVDFLIAEGRIVFGEMTLYPAAAQIKFTPEFYDRYWGDALRLPARYRRPARTACRRG